MDTKIAEVTLCSECHKQEAEWDFGSDENLCQDCFENMCNREFWKAVDEGWVF